MASTRENSPAVTQARQALARADAAVDADKAAHSPGRVAVNEKRARRAEIQLSKLSAPPSPGPRLLSIVV